MKSKEVITLNLKRNRKMSFALLAAFVLLLFLNGCKPNEGGADNSMKFNEIVPDKIVKISSKQSSTGIDYSITNKTKIDQFIEILNSTTYSKTEPYEPTTGNSGLGFYNDSDEMVSSLTSNGLGTYKIGNDYYLMDTDISANLSAFYKDLYTDENIVN